MSRAARSLLWLTLLGAAAYAVLFAVLAALRLTYPFEIEWMEGGMLTHAARLMGGQAIYAAPSADFVPFFYTPAYPTLLAGLAGLTGELSYTLARGVSVLSTAVAMALIFRIGQREADWRFGLLAMGLYAALFRVNGAFYDLARPDALFTALLMAAVYVVYYWQGWRGVVAAAVLFSLGFFTKQTVSVFVPACALYLLWRNGRHAVVFVALTVALTAAGIAWLDHDTDGWFWTYVFEGHQGHLFYWKNILLQYWRDLLVVAPLLLLLPLLWFRLKVPIAALTIILALWWTAAWIFRAKGFDYDAPHMYYVDLWYYAPPRWRILVPSALIAALLSTWRLLNRQPRTMRTHGFWLWMFIAGAGASGLNHSTQWAYSNSLMLISLFAAVLIALALRDLLEHPGRADWLIPAAVVVQLVAWIYDPIEQVPTGEDRAAIAHLDAHLHAIDGPILMPAHPFHTWKRDGQVHVHQMGIQDVAFMGGIKDLAPRLRRKRWAAVIIDEGNRVPGVEGPYYLGARIHYPSRQALRTRTGFLVRPKDVWLAQDPDPRALVPGISANFEEAGWTGWVPSDGGAFGTRPSPQRRAQGEQVARSNNGGAKAKGRLSTQPFVLPAERLSFLLGGSGKRRVAIRVDSDGKVLARRRGTGTRTRLRRLAVDLRGHQGKTVVIRLIDDDEEGDLIVDDLRFEPSFPNQPSKAGGPK